MLTSVLLHVGGLVTVIIVSIVISIFSSRKKEKKSASFFRQFVQDQQPDEPIDNDNTERASFIPDSPEIKTDESQVTPKQKRQSHPSQSQKANPGAPLAEDPQESEYSLKDKDAAKRAIIYSEILKPKF